MHFKNIVLSFAFFLFSVHLLEANELLQLAQQISDPCKRAAISKQLREIEEQRQNLEMQIREVIIREREAVRPRPTMYYDTPCGQGQVFSESPAPSHSVLTQSVELDYAVFP
ncbi:MAG: hypothetical protein WD055_05590 [Candidatus Dependentiae bacterium]